MGDTYLATGFKDVDGSDALDTYAACLSFLDSLEFYQRYKEETYRLLGLQNGDIVLDAGCGLGYDLYRMAERVFPNGKAVGVDASVAFLDEAKKDRRYSVLNVELCRADLKALPFENDYFTHSRIDRVLQHIPEPQKALDELARTLGRSGMLLAYDNDWRSFSIDTADSSITQKIESLWSNAFANPRIGTELPELLRRAGLSEIEVYPLTSVIRDFETAERVYDLTSTLQKLIESKRVTEDEVKRWIGSAKEEREFRVTLDSFIVTGRKI